jgi:hypothetical protein
VKAPTNTFLGIVAFAMTPVAVDAAELQLSFLDHAAPQAELTRVLKEAGCQEASCDALLHVVRVHNQSIRYDRGRLGAAAEGWFSFSSPGSLLGLMPYPFFETPTSSSGIEQHTLTCFDVAALLLRDSAPPTFTPSLWPSGSGLLLRRDYLDADGASLALAPGEIYPLNGYQYLTDQEARSVQEDAIILGFRALRRITVGDTSPKGMAEAVVRKKLADLRAKGLALDGRIKPLVIHYVKPDERYLGGEHIGLLMHRDAKSYYLEKNGPSGPFVFLLADGQQSIIDYVAGHYDLGFQRESCPDLIGSIMVLSLGSDIMLSEDYRRAEGAGASGP